MNMRNKTLVLLGRSGVGKDSIRDELVNNHQFNSILSYTTRPMRENEKQGVSYYYVSDEIFNGIEFIEQTAYTVYNGEIWRYGTRKSDMLNDISKKIVILNPEGVRNIARQIGRENLYVIEIVSPINLIEKRLIERGDNINEIKRRIQCDDVDFKDSKDFCDDTIINGENAKIEDLAAEINFKFDIHNIRTYSV